MKKLLILSILAASISGQVNADVIKSVPLMNRGALMDAYPELSSNIADLKLEIELVSTGDELEGELPAIFVVAKRNNKKVATLPLESLNLPKQASRIEELVEIDLKSDGKAYISSTDMVLLLSLQKLEMSHLREVLRRGKGNKNLTIEAFAKYITKLRKANEPAALAALDVSIDFRAGKDCAQSERSQFDKGLSTKEYALYLEVYQILSAKNGCSTKAFNKGGSGTSVVDFIADGTRYNVGGVITWNSNTHILDVPSDPASFICNQPGASAPLVVNVRYGGSPIYNVLGDITYFYTQNIVLINTLSLDTVCEGIIFKNGFE